MLATVEQKQRLSQHEVAAWVRTRENDLFYALQRFGTMYGLGRQIVTRGEGRVLGKIRSFSGEFTGVDLCRVANVALGLGIENNFRRRGFEVENVYIETYDKDTSLGPWGHNILRVRKIKNNESVTLDPTLRQFAVGIRPRMVPIFPSNNEDRVYKGMRVIRIISIDELQEGIEGYVYERYGSEGLSDLREAFWEAQNGIRPKKTGLLSRGRK